MWRCVWEWEAVCVWNARRLVKGISSSTMQQRRSLLHALGLAVALLPSGSAAVVSLDAQGVERVMSSARLTLVKFVHRARYPLALRPDVAQLGEQGFTPRQE